MKRFGLFVLLGLLVAGCSKEVDIESLEKKSAEEIFSVAKAEMQAGRYRDAVKVFEELERLYPYSGLVADAQLGAGDCSYKAKKYEEAISSYEIFVKTHPTHDKVPYAIYMLGMLNYEQMPIIERDQQPTIEAFDYFTELCNRYPESKYSIDAQKKLFILKQQIAAREVYVARYYQKNKNYAAAINRLNTVVDKYLETAHAPEAMHRLVECYVAMGFVNEAERVNKLLQKNYPASNWAQYSKTLLSKPKAK